jgi:hypothetical protein
MVEFEHSTESLSSFDRARVFANAVRFLGEQDDVVFPLMVPFLMEMDHVLGQGVSQRGLPEQDQPR